MTQLTRRNRPTHRPIRDMQVWDKDGMELSDSLDRYFFADYFAYGYFA